MTAKSKKSSHGGPRPNSGRKRGTKNPATIAREELLEEVAVRAADAADIGIEATPLDFMLNIMRDPESPAAMKFEAAKAAAPYVHPRLSQVESRVTRVNDVSDLTIEQIDELLAGRLAEGKAAHSDSQDGADCVH